MIKAENIATKEFKKSLYGYDCEQVDLFLDELIVQIRQMEQERLEMASTIEYLVSKVSEKTDDIREKEEVVGPVSPHSLPENIEIQQLFVPDDEENDEACSTSDDVSLSSDETEK